MRIDPPAATKGDEELSSAPGNAVKASASVQADPSPVHALAEPVLSFEQLYDDHVDFIWRSARRLGVAEDAADDVAQQVFVVAHRRLGEFEGRASAKTWLFAILVRVVRDHRRSLRRKSPHLSSETMDPDAIEDDALASNPYELLSLAEASRLINHLLSALDEDRRVVFVMAELEQMTPAEIALALELDVKLVYARLRAARTDFEHVAARLRKRAEKGAGP